MEHNFMKGQAAVEFLLIILIGVLYITTIIIPNVENAEDRIIDVSNFAKLTVSAEKLSKSIQYISLAGDGSKQTIQMIVPSDSTFDCANLPGAGNTVINISYDTQTNSFYEGGISPTNKCFIDDKGTTGPGAEDDDTIVCKKTLDPGVDFSCSGTIDPGIYITTIEKDTTQSTPIVIDFTKISDI